VLLVAVFVGLLGVGGATLQNPPFDPAAQLPEGLFTPPSAPPEWVGALVAEATTSTTVVSTTVPGDGVFVGVGESIQAVVDAHGAGTTFVIGAGTHHRQSVVPKEGDVFVGESGAVLSGDGVSEFAFQAAEIGSVTIRGLTIEEYATPTQKGVIENAGGSYGWVVDGNVIRYNGGTGIRADSGWRVVNNVIDHNGQLGLYASGSGILVSGNEISFNNTQGVDSHWEAGGTKFGHTTNLVVRGNYVHDNDGPGLWTDGANVNTLYEQNRVIDNRGPGIDHEVSGAAVIRNNVVEGNGFAWTGWVDGAGILVNSSPDVEVYGNTVRYNNDGIAGIYADRSDGGPLKNLWVHDNVIAMNTGQTGVVTNAGNVVFSPEWNNRFDYNTYTLGSGSAYYRWADGEITVEQWKATGQDAHSTWN
jgi:parallel beta-helix repeat protein